jgi:hypothetical protein
MQAPVPVDETRVLAVVDDQADAALVVGAAYRTIGPARPAEAVLCRLFDLGTYDGLFASHAAEEGEAVRSMRMLRALGSFPPEGVHVVPIAFGSVDAAADLVEIARSREVDIVVVGAANPAAGAMVRSLNAAGICAVVYHDSGTGESRPGPVLLDGELPEARQIAEAIAGALEGTVVASGDAAAVAAIVTGPASPTTPTGTPTYVVYPAEVSEPLLRGASAG